jgi:hypothetical protein
MPCSTISPSPCWPAPQANGALVRASQQLDVVVEAIDMLRDNGASSLDPELRLLEEDA